MEVACDPGAPAAVRESLRRIGGLGPSRGDAMLVASELVTNALLQAGSDLNGRLSISVSRGAGTITVAVLDPDAPAQPAPANVPIDAGSGGLGLLIVGRLARRWGSQREPGYRVWAELPCAEAR